MAAEKTELRGLAPTDLVQALDAIALSRGMDRTTLINKMLTTEVKRIGHEMNLLQRMARGNPLLSDADGSATDFGALQ